MMVVRTMNSRQRRSSAPRESQAGRMQPPHHGDEMQPTALPPRSTRRWPRYQIDLPVRVVAVNGILTTPVMARGSDISRAGMALDAKIALNPGDLMRLQFPTTEPSCVNAIVRHRNGRRLGLEFLSQLPPDDETYQMKSLPAPVFREHRRRGNPFPRRARRRTCWKDCGESRMNSGN